MGVQCWYYAQSFNERIRYIIVGYLILDETTAQKGKIILFADVNKTWAYREPRYFRYKCIDLLTLWTIMAVMCNLNKYWPMKLLFYY